MVREREAGVVAIVMTLAISTFLLGIAALAVDLGRAYLRENELQSLADRLALAGAKGLPTIGEPEGALNQITTALEAICASDEQDETLCPALSPAAWTDGIPANGEVTFFADPDSDGRFSPDTESTESTALRVVLPPSTVQFGLGGAIGFSSARIQKSASARIGTPLGSGMLPFALTPDDLAAGRFCISATAGTFESDRYSKTASPTGNVRIALNSAFPQGLPATGTAAWFTLTPSSTWLPVREASFYLRTPGGATQRLVARRTGWHSFRVQLPPQDAGSAVQVWATGHLTRASSSAFTTGVLNLTYAGTPPPPDPVPSASPCETPRGFVQLAHAGAGDLTAALEQNIRSGPSTTLLPTSGEVLNLVPTDNFMDAFRRGLLEPSGNQPGRLIGDTGNGTESVNGYQVDATDLFESPHLLDPQYAGGSGQSLRTRLERAAPAEAANRGWITSAVVRSKRLAVLPVIDPEPLGGENDHQITSFRYVWMDGAGEGRGLLWENGQLVGLEGFVLDSGYLPEVVSGSGTVGPFLGSEMPRETLLIGDLSRNRR
jgi:Flp pilus assembly protein TadG